MEESIQITLDKETYGGNAMGRLPDNRAVFVPFALAGERASIRLVEEKRGYARGELLEVLQPARERIPAHCPHFGTCGGCHYQNLPYDAQLGVKTDILRDQLVRIGQIADPAIQPMQGCSSPWNYRNHVQFHLTRDGKLGNLAIHSRQVLPIRECHLPEDPLNALWHNLEFEEGSGVERIDLRLGAEGEMLMVLESSLPEPPGLELEAGISVVHLFEGESLVLAGDGHQFMELHPEGVIRARRFMVSATSFFQVNTDMAGRMVGHVLANLPDKVETLLELYCGVGLFSAFLAPRVGRLIGIEASPSACADFVENLDEFDNVELYEAPVAQVLPGLKLKADVILADPPRAGLEPSVLQAILGMQPKTLIYISCDPATLARDARHLLPGGYHLQQVTPFDMFPQTFHIESVSIFSR